MKFTVDRLKLQKALQKVSNIIGSRSMLPLLSNVLISASEEGLELCTTDLELRLVTRVEAEVAESGVTTLPEMIRKMTSLPAEVYRIPNKGRIAVGYDADLCLFDPEKIRDNADYVNCSAPNDGLSYVIIDGKVVVENGIYNSTRAGKILIR